MPVWGQEKTSHAGPVGHLLMSSANMWPPETYRWGFLGIVKPKLLLLSIEALSASDLSTYMIKYNLF